MDAFLGEGNHVRTAYAERKLDEVLTLVARARVLWIILDSLQQSQKETQKCNRGERQPKNECSLSWYAYLLLCRGAPVLRPRAQLQPMPVATTVELHGRGRRSRASTQRFGCSPQSTRPAASRRRTRGAWMVRHRCPSRHAGLGR
jgi:hypothetical protein